MNEVRLHLAAILLAFFVVLSGCSRSEESADPPPLQGADMGGTFELTSETVSDADFEGQYRLIYFGYTYCPDVCPVDMQVLGGGMRLLEESNPELAERIQPIFISVDPARDTPEVLREFTNSFHPRLLGLTGSQETIDSLTQKYGMYYSLGEDDGEGNYLVDHSNNVVFYGPEGEPLAIIPTDDGPNAFAAEIERWAQ